MAPLSSQLLSCSLLLSAALSVQGARRVRRALGSAVPSTDPRTAKFIAGVPVLNHHLAFGGKGTVSSTAAAAEDVEGREENWILVVPRGLKDDEVEALCLLSKQGCKMMGHPGSGGVPFFKLRSSEEELRGVLEDSPGLVKFVEPDLKVHKIPDAEDEEVTSLGAHVSAANWGLERIGASKRATEGRGVHVYIMDTGIRATHSDFGGRVVPTLDMTSSRGECGSNALCASDFDGHGTHCAGVAAGKRYGVAPKARLHSTKVLGNDGSGEWSWMYGALDWIATKGARPAVASMSIGGGGTSRSMEEAIDSSVNAGVTVVVAAGNENLDSCNFMPSFVPSAITVGSTNLQDGRSIFSNYGECTDIWAPGTSITSDWYRSDTATQALSGTSMACPHVAGGAALLLEASPRLKSAQVLQRLLDDASVNYISGLKTKDVNVLLYVGADAPPPAGAPPPPPKPVCGWNGSGPDSLGDCKCDSGFSCYEGRMPGCPYSWTSSSGGYDDTYFLPSCDDCVCK